MEAITIAAAAKRGESRRAKSTSNPRQGFLNLNPVRLRIRLETPVRRPTVLAECAVAFETAVFGLALGALALAAAWFGAAQARRAGRLEIELEGARDAFWRAEDRIARVAQEGERALAEARSRAEAGAVAKSRFLATVTHEMRTPLSGVIGTARLLLDAELAPDQRTYARAIVGSAEAMLSLVDESLDLSRFEAERPALQAAPFVVSGLVEDVAELLAPRAHAKGLDIAVHIGRDVPAEIVSDSARVRQILLNLAGNAIKFTGAGGLGLRVDRIDQAVRLTVADTGPGFDPAETERLFQEFERASDDPAAGGVGLGLAISRRLAEAMGGTLTGQAAPGEGARFALTLPVADDGPVSPPLEPLVGRRVAVVSRAPFSGPWLIETLVEAGAEATLVDRASGAGRIEAHVAGTAADTVLIDRGAAACVKELAAAARAGGARRVLVLLSPAERGDLQRLAADGFDGYLVKPVRAASLVARVSAADGFETARPAAGGSTGPALATGPGLKVLVAEDDPVSALIALAHLSRLGHVSAHVVDGLAACAAFEQSRFDVVLLDVRMPKLDGCAAARRMRAWEAASGLKPATLLALTANVGASDRAAAIGAGMDGLLEKPLDRRALAILLEPLRRRAAAAA